MTCPECKGNQRVPDHGIWTKICPTCKGKGVIEDKEKSDEMV